jgi:hypothetical protein
MKDRNYFLLKIFINNIYIMQYAFFDLQDMLSRIIACIYFVNVFIINFVNNVIYIYIYILHYYERYLKISMHL